jgi:hypothetical protein
MSNKQNTMTAVITDDIKSWEHWKEIQRLFNKSVILTDDNLVLEFADKEKHIRIDTDKVSEYKGVAFDDVRYMKDIIKYKDIKVGMLLVPDLDGFMLGNRWLVTEKREDGSFYTQHHSCGKRNPYVCSDWIIKNDADREYWYQIGETLELWQKKFNKVNGKIILL